MKKLFAIVVIVAMACDNEEPKDPFSGSWEFDLPSIEGSFEIHGNGQYEVKNIMVNGEAWTRSDVREVEPKTEIGLLIIGKDPAALNPIAFFNCKVSADQKTIHADSVWVYSGLDAYSTVYDQQINRK